MLGIQQIWTHHVLSTVMLENLPQLCVQGFLIFYLGINSTIVLVSFSSSIFNILMSILTAVVHFVLNRGQNDSKFTILLSWTQRSKNLYAVLGSTRKQTTSGSLDPFLETGRRVSLATELSKITFGASKTMSFEILATTKQVSSCLIHGVMQFDKDSESDSCVFASFKDKRIEIKAAIIRAFKYHPRFTNVLDFAIEIHRKNVSSREEEAQLTVDMMTKLGAPASFIAQFQDHLRVNSTEIGVDCGGLSVSHQPVPSHSVCLCLCW